MREQAFLVIDTQVNNFDLQPVYNGTQIYKRLSSPIDLTHEFIELAGGRKAREIEL